VSERQRFEFLVKCDGLAAALEFERHNVRDTYRDAAYIARKGGRYSMYRRRLLQGALEARAILRDHGSSTGRR
jgi:hypothetical protein